MDYQFVNRGSGSFPFTVKYALDNGLIVSIIWINGFAHGDKTVKFFEAGLFFNDDMVEDVQQQLDFLEVATLIQNAAKLDSKTIPQLIADGSIWSKVMDGVKPL